MWCASTLFYWRYDTGQELELLNRLWRLVSLRLNFFTPTKKAVGYSTTAHGRKKRIYDKPATPWQRLQASGVLDTQQLSVITARVDGINPARSAPAVSTPSRCSCSTWPRPRPKPSPPPVTST